MEKYGLGLWWGEESGRGQGFGAFFKLLFPPWKRRNRRRKGLAFLTDYFLICHQISETSTALWINTLLGVSTLLALWTLAILFRQAKMHLGEQNIGGKFVLFQVTRIGVRR